MMLTLVVLVGVLLPGGAALFGRNTLSLNVEGFASDEYVSNEKYGVGLNNAISLNISLQGVFGTITSVDEEIEHDIDTLELYKKLSENIFDTVPKWLVLKPPEEFPVRSISVVEPHNCTGTSLTSGRQNFSFFQAGKRYVLQLPELPNLECSGLKVHVATRNPAELLYAYDSRWKAYLVSNNAMQHDFYDSSKPWKRSLIADGYWRGIFPLKSKVCGLFSEWTMNSSILCPLGGAAATNETDLLATLIRDHSFSAGVSAVGVACPGPAVTVSMAPLDEDTATASASEILSRTMLSFTPPAWTGADQLKSVGMPVRRCDTLSDKSLMSDKQWGFFWTVGVCSCIALVAALAGFCYFSCTGDLKVGFLSLIAIPIVLFSFIPAVIGAVLGVAILAISMGLIKTCDFLVNRMPMGESPTDDFSQLVLRIVELLGVAPLKSGMLLFRYVYDFIILKSAMLTLAPMLKLDVPDIEWFINLSWPTFFCTLPDWCFIRWPYVSWILTPIFACVATFLSRAFEFVRGMSFHIGRFGAPCRETLLLSSTPFVYMAVFVLYFFATQDLFLRLVPATITAKQKCNVLSLIAPNVVAVFFTLIFAFTQLIANTCSDMLAIGLPTALVDLSTVGTVLPSEFCAHPVGWPVFITAQLCWSTSVVVFLLLFILILTGSAYQMREQKDDSAGEDRVGLKEKDFDNSRHTEENAQAYEDKLISHDEICTGGFCEKITSLDYLSKEKAEFKKNPPRWVGAQILELIQITLGIWAEGAAEKGEEEEALEAGICGEIGAKLLDSVESYNMEGRKDWCITRVGKYLDGCGWDPENDDFQERSKRAMESNADEFILLITVRQMSLIMQCSFLTTIPAKILEYTNQVVLCDCAHSLKIHEQFRTCPGFGRGSGFLFLLPLYLASVARLICLFIMMLGPYFGSNFETLQTVFSVASVLCFFSGFYDVVSSWFKDFHFKSDLESDSDEPESDSEE